MASVASAGTSPLSGYEYAGDSTGDPDENPWTFVSMPGSSGPSSAGGYFPSPATSAVLGSSWGFISHGTSAGGAHSEPSLPAASPLNLDTDLPAGTVFDTSPFADHAGLFSAASAAARSDNHHHHHHHQQQQQHHHAQQQQQQHLFIDHLFQTTAAAEPDFFAAPTTTTAAAAAAAASSLLSAQFADLSTFLGGDGGLPPLTSEEQQALSAIDFDIPAGLLPGADVPPWSPTDLRDTAPATAGSIAGSSPIFVMEDPSFISPSPPQELLCLSSPSVSSSPHAASVSPRASPPAAVHIKREDAGAAAAPITIRKVKDARVGKKKKTPPSASPLSGSSGSSSSSSGLSTFLIVTPDSVNAHADKSNPFDCHDAHRSTQRGRKGPLASETKQSALRVRRLGACFHCHARKVKCEADRPCRNCQKLRLQVPHAMCWQFDDFDVVLFPEFIRGHFAKDEMARFFADNIAGFRVDGLDGDASSCAVELSSAPRFAATLAVRAKFFTAKTDEVLQHWHLQHGRGGAADLRARGAVPIGFDPDGPSQRDELRKKTDRYIQAIVGEAAFADVVTDVRYTRLPRTIIRIVQEYAQRTDNTMVKRALSIYAMHYVMTRHLTLTPQTVASLASTKLVPQDVPFLTSRVLNRQIKAVIDDLMRQEMGKLFKSFGSTLKPKERKGWAPCLAAFLVLCLFMETVEEAADTFVVTENQICLQKHTTPTWQRTFALEKNAEIENMPFKQVAFQFHQLYQTHSRDAGSRSFNPLLDDACLEPGELDREAAAMVMQLRRLLEDPNWGELDYLTMDPDPAWANQEKFPTRNLPVNYTGRLAAKFLLSFTDERYIIERNDC